MSALEAAAVVAPSPPASALPQELFRWEEVFFRAPQMAATMVRYLDQLQVSARPATLRAYDDALRMFAGHITTVDPACRSVSAVEHRHVEAHKTWMASRPGRSGGKLSAAQNQICAEIALVTPDGEAREVASDIAFPNGMVVTPDNSTLIVAESFAQRLTAFDIASDGSLSNRRAWAEPVGPDGICLDADGCIWASSGAMTNDCARIREGGEVLERVELDRSCFATMLGGPDRRTLFMLVADWRGPENVDDTVEARTGQVLVVDAPASGVGWP